MTSIHQIILARGGYERLANNPICVKVPGFMPLTVETIGTGPRDGTLIAVHHSREQNGDLMYDPEVVFELVEQIWCPLSFENSGLAYWEVVFLDAESGKLMCRPKLLQDLRRFCHMWNQNISDQGFVAAAHE